MALLVLRTARSLRLVLVAAFAAGAVHVWAQEGRVEDEVKAVFLLNFAKYVSWPPATLNNQSSAPIRICVAAATDFVDIVKSAIAGESVDGHPLIALTPATMDEARDCHILYVAKPDVAKMRPVLEALRTTPILTIVDGSTQKDDDGSVIVLVRDQNRVRFDVSRSAAAAKGLAISSKLLRVARRVEGP